MNNKNLFIVIGIFFVVLFNGLVYSALNSEIFINGEGHIRVDSDIRITNLKVSEQVGGAYETYNSDYSKDSTSIQVALPSSESVMVYEVSITNNSSSDYYFVNLVEESYSNCNIKYEILNLKEGDIIYANSTINFKIKLTTSINDISNNCSLVLKYLFKDSLVFSFDYTGDVQEFTANIPGIYKLEVWGASGSGAGSSLSLGTGGYSVGTKELQKGESLYIYVGEQGKNSVEGSFNGGGACNCYLHQDSRFASGGGGGASDIRTSQNNDYQDRIMVAGGGGSVLYIDGKGSTPFGYGGGEIAGSSYAYRGIKNIYNANGAIGGSCGYISGERNLEFFAGSGGGGYIGGEGIVANDGQWTSPNWPLFLRGMAAGGTGYVGGVESSIIYGIEAKTIGGNMEIPTHDGLSTMNGNLGNGYAKITLLGKSD